ncbi:MAG: polysaccharide biosynthesis protein [Lachnospiraceae bacterium]|nr:polysaccharide biosynthesis protein [Lachnospiraceae bacterium]
MADEKNTKSNILVQGTILAMASVIVRLIGLIYRVPMTRLLGDEAMGYYGMAYEFYNLALILSSYSLPLAVSKLVSARVTQGQHQNARRVFRHAMLFGAVVGGIATSVCYFGAELYGRMIEMPGVVIPLKVLAPTIFVFSLMGVIRGYFQGHNNMVPTAISQILEQIVNACVSVGAAWYMLRRYEGFDNQLSYGAAGGTFGTFAGAVAAMVSLLFIYFCTRKMFNRLIAEERRSEEKHAQERSVRVVHLIIITVIPVVVSQTVYQISGFIDNYVFNNVMITKGFSDSVRSTWWSIYTNKYKLLTNVPVAIASAMGTAIVPGLIAEYVRGRMDVVRDKVASAVKFNMIIAFPCAAGMSVLSGPILMMLFGDGRIVSRNMLQLGSVSIVVFALSTLTNGILQGINRLNIPVIHSLIALAIHTVVLYWMLTFTTLNVYALMVANVLFAFVVCVLNWRAVGKYLNYKQEIRTTFVIPAIASGFMAFACRCLYDCLTYFHLGVTVSCIAAIAFAVPVYFATLILMRGVTKEQLLAMPKGALIVKILTKCRLLR